MKLDADLYLLPSIGRDTHAHIQGGLATGNVKSARVSLLGLYGLLALDGFDARLGHANRAALSRARRQGELPLAPIEVTIQSESESEVWDSNQRRCRCRCRTSNSCTTGCYFYDANDRRR